MDGQKNPEAKLGVYHFWIALGLIVQDTNLRRDHTFPSFLLFILNFIPFIERFSIEPSDVNKYVFSGVTVGDESVTFGLVKKFYCSFHSNK